MKTIFPLLLRRCAGAMLILALASGIFPVHAQEDCDLTNRINNLLSASVVPRPSGSTVGFYLKQVNGPVLAASNETFAFEPASMIKVLFHAHALRQVQDGTITLGTLLNWNKNTADDRPGARPVFAPFCTFTPQVNTSSLSNLLQGMMVQSDNRFTQAVRNFFGDGNIINTAGIIGMPNTQLNHNIGCICNNRLHNRTSLADLGELYEDVFTGFLNPAFQNTFRQLMVNETNSGMKTAIDNIADAEGGMLGLTPTQIQQFKDGILLANKAGSYKCFESPSPDSSLWTGRAGWVQLPVKESPTVIGFRQFVYGTFMDSVHVSANSNTVLAELLRDQIRAALETWKANSIYSFDIPIPGITGPVGTTGPGSSFPNAVDVVALGNNRVVTPYRDAAGNLKIAVWYVFAGSFPIQIGQASAGFVSHVKVARLTDQRIATAVRNASGNLQIDVWDIQPNGQVIRRGKGLAGFVNDLDLVRLSLDRIVTPVSTANVDLKVIVWDIDAAGNVTRRGDQTVPSANVVSGSAFTSVRFATATRDVSFGNLKVQSWSVSAAGNPALLDQVETDYAVTDIAVTTLNNLRFVTSTQRGNLSHGSFVWDICTADGSIAFSGDISSGNIFDVANTAFTNDRFAVATRGTAPGNTLGIMVYDAKASGRPVNLDLFMSTDGSVNQVKMATLQATGNPQSLVTASVNSATGNLELRIWRLYDFGILFSKADEPDMHEPDTEINSLAQESGPEQSPAATFTAYPNPFSNTTRIRFSSPDDDHVTVAVYSVTGQQVQILYDDHAEGGLEYEVVLDGYDMPAGMYIYRMITGKGVSRTGKLILDR